MHPSLSIRPAIHHDIPAILDMSWALTLEERSHATVQYPQIGERTQAEMAANYRQYFNHPLFHTEVVQAPEELAGYASATILPRIAGEPRVSMRLDTIYLKPAYRATFGHISTCKELVGAIWQWGSAALTDCGIPREQHVIEGSFMPGGSSERLWRAAGLKPFLTLCAWVNDDGTPNTPSMQRYIGGQHEF